MKMLFILLAILCVGSFELVNASDGDKIQLIKLVSGESIKGKVSGVKDGEVAVITDYGVMRVPVEKLTAESKSSLGLELGKGGEQNVDVAQLKERILDLEKLVARLRVENAELRRQGVAASSPVADT